MVYTLLQLVKLITDKLTWSEFLWQPPRRRRGRFLGLLWYFLKMKLTWLIKRICNLLRQCTKCVYTDRKLSVIDKKPSVSISVIRTQGKIFFNYLLHTCSLLRCLRLIIGILWYFYLVCRYENLSFFTFSNCRIFSSSSTLPSTSNYQGNLIYVVLSFITYILLLRKIIYLRLFLNYELLFC